MFLAHADFNGDMYLPIMLNSIVHVLVYLHYVLTALGRHSWWSRHLTKLQLTQFVVRRIGIGSDQIGLDWVGLGWIGLD